MKMSNYWEERGEALVKAMENNGEEYLKHREKTVKGAIKTLETEINSWYQRYADAEGITLSAAKKKLTYEELNHLRMDVDKYIELGESLDPEVAVELEKASAAAHISRLQSMTISLMGTVETIYKNSQTKMTETIKKAYKDSYYMTAYNIQQNVGVGFDLGKVDEKVLDKLVHKPWTPDGRNFSDRVWANKKKLMRELETTFTQGVIRGEAPAKTVKKIKDKLNSDHNATHRLVMTESAYFASEGSKDGYKELDVEQYKILATLDSNTSETCRNLDGKVFKMSEYKIGVTAPPFHVYCRTTTVPYYGAEYETGVRAARDAKGEEYELIDENLTYEDWKDHYVDGKPLKKKGKNSLITKKKQILNKSIKDNNDEIAKLTNQLPKDDVITGVWKDPVTLSEWSNKKNSIPDKFKYFDDKIAEGVDVEKFTKLKDNLIDFDKKGQAYSVKLEDIEELKHKNKLLENELNKLNKKSKLKSEDVEFTTSDLYTQDRKNNAYWFKAHEKDKADKVMRGKTGDIWSKLSEEDRNAAYKYTAGSGRYNRPLAGFKKPWVDYGSGWEEKFKISPNKVWIDYEDMGDNIRRLTKVIEKSKSDHDMWLQRGCDTHAMDSFFGFKFGTFKTLSDDGLQKLVGNMSKITNFVSCGTTRGTGFGGKVILNIYAPKGTEMLYAEPFSAYGAGDKLKWDGKSEQKYFNDEFETIIQRGATYCVTKIEKKNDKFYIDLEVRVEKGYDKFQQDPKEWSGSTEKYK